MDEEKTLKEKLGEVDKKVIIAFVAGGIVGSILAKRNTKGTIMMARAEGYSTGACNILKAILPANKII